MNTRHVEPEGQQKSAGIWLHGWKFEVPQEAAALGKRPMTCAALSAVESAVADGAEEDIRQMAVSLRKFVLLILIVFWLECKGECLEILVWQESGRNIRWGRQKEQSIKSTSRTKKSSQGDSIKVKERTMQDQLRRVKEKKSRSIVYQINRQGMTT